MPRKAWSTAAGIALSAVAAVVAVASPVHAAGSGMASVTSSTKVQYKASSGKQNRVVITRSGNAITIDDKVAVSAGKGCKKVKGDKTKVTCTTKKAPSRVTVYTYDRNDVIVNNTDVRMSAFSGTGSDTVTGGSRSDAIQAGSGNDRADGRGGMDTLWGMTGNDTLRGGTTAGWAVTTSTAATALTGSTATTCTKGPRRRTSCSAGPAPISSTMPATPRH
jgi:serralysin